MPSSLHKRLTRDMLETKDDGCSVLQVALYR